jgi:hypothetical protein
MQPNGGVTDPMRDYLEMREKTLEARITELEREIEPLRDALRVITHIAGKRAHPRRVGGEEMRGVPRT